MKNYFFVIVLTILVKLTFSQNCQSCTIDLTDHDTLSRIINAGDVFCISENGLFEGKLVLNGGTVCNKGIFKPKELVLIQGYLNNYNTINLNYFIELPVGVFVSNTSAGSIDITGILKLAGGFLSNLGIITVQDEVSGSSGTVTNSGIINCKEFISPGVLSNSGVLNEKKTN